MYKILVICLFGLMITSCESYKTNFEVVKVESFWMREEMSNAMYKIALKTDKSFALYPINISNFTDSEKADLIEELLKFENDTRLCVYPIANYNPELQQVYMGNLNDYSLQVEALFLINQILLEEPFKFSPIPILINIDTNEESSINGDIVKKAYEEYNKWFIEFKKQEVDKIKLTPEQMPLTNTNINWIYSSY